MGPSSTTIDIERAEKATALRCLDGYLSFAEFIARDRDAAIYRKFGGLSARNLLYLQSELHYLEGRLHALDKEDAESLGNDNACKVAREWRYYSDGTNPRAELHRELQASIKVKLEYRERQ